MPSAGEALTLLSKKTLYKRTTLLYTVLREKKAHRHSAQARTGRETGKAVGSAGCPGIVADPQGDRRVPEAPEVSGTPSGCCHTTPLIKAPCIGGCRDYPQVNILVVLRKHPSLADRPLHTLPTFSLSSQSGQKSLCPRLPEPTSFEFRERRSPRPLPCMRCPQSTPRRMRMLISKDNGGKTIGWRETYVSKDDRQGRGENVFRQDAASIRLRREKVNCW